MHTHACTPLSTQGCVPNPSTLTISAATAVSTAAMGTCCSWHPLQVVCDTLHDRIYGTLFLFFQQGTYCYTHVRRPNPPKSILNLYPQNFAFGAIWIQLGGKATE